VSLRALLCDDDAPIRAMVRDLLTERGVEVLEAVDGRDALVLFVKEARIDFVVTDFLMPRLDGMQLVRSIRLSGARGRLPIIMMSAISRSHILEGEAREVAGPDHYVAKPFKLKKMAKVLDDVLEDLRRRA